MKAIVTGAAGFIGFHLSKKLLELGYEVLGIDNISDYYDISIKEKRISFLRKSNNFFFLKLDLNDYNNLNNSIIDFQPKVIYHLAAQAGVRYSVENPIGTVNANIQITINLLESCKENGIKDFVYASSSSVYGSNTDPPFKETDVIDSPVSVYAASKRSCELMLHVYHKMYGLNVKILRFFTVYGPWNRPDMAIYQFSSQILNNKSIKVYNNGDHFRDFTFVSDIVDGIIDSLSSDEGYEIFNLGSDEPVSLKELINKLELRLGKESTKEYLPLQKGDVYLTHASIEKARRMFGYSPKVKFDEGLDLFIDWYIKHH